MPQSKKNSKLKKKKKLIRGLKCSLCASGVTTVSYKDVFQLKKFITRKGKIIPRLRSGNCASHQRAVARAIKRARVMALMPYSVNE